ncbi:hypothetical protein [Arcanobacterium ihumii]|uniref:hypothetical protein n=1 Tax=Arcanobacterium ihumii TaxID=2138162 RepID=UPI000F53CF7A|nr:hypothetical protein [Arcanobacterium ihumii]
MFPTVFWLLIFGVVALAIIIAIGILRARKLNSLHLNALKSRRLLERALYSRAQHAQDFAELGALDVASAVLLKAAAQEAAHFVGTPIIDDGLDSLSGVPSLAIADDAPSSADELSVNSGLVTAPVVDRLVIESELSRVLQLTVDELEETELDDEVREVLRQLNRDRNEVRLTRRFHNIHVSQARRVRRSTFTRILRLAGSAPLPQTVDLVDE